MPTYGASARTLFVVMCKPTEGDRTRTPAGTFNSADDARSWAEAATDQGAIGPHWAIAPVIRPEDLLAGVSVLKR